jgi:hypothetical protein
MPSLITTLTPQESVGNRTNKLSQRRDGIELARLLAAAQTDISILQANYNTLLLLLAHLPLPVLLSVQLTEQLMVRMSH